MYACRHLEKMNKVHQFDFRFTETTSSLADNAMLSAAFGSLGVEANPINGLAGPFLMGQLEQLARHPAVGKVELVVPMMLD